QAEDGIRGRNVTGVQTCSLPFLSLPRYTIERNKRFQEAVYMKKMINDPDRVVQDMTDGLAAAYPDKVRKIPDTTVIVRNDAPVGGKVGLVSGGGSGHEPAHAGYVGR